MPLVSTEGPVEAGMTRDNETIPDIVTEMCKCAEENPRLKIVPRMTIQTWLNLASRLKAAYKREMDEAAEHINNYLQEISANPEPHNWLIRNGYKDESYQECLFGQEIVKDNHPQEEGNNGLR